MSTNIQFLRGSSEALKAISVPSDGVFYLTEDTKKLHVGLVNESGATIIYELNKDIEIYKNLADLEEKTAKEKFTTNSFFFLEEENSLTVKTENGFFNINPIHSVSAEFTISEDEKILSINKIEQNKIIGLEETYATKKEISDLRYIKATGNGGNLEDNLGNLIILDCGGLE